MSDGDPLSLLYRPPQMGPTAKLPRGYRPSAVRGRVASGLVAMRMAMDLGYGALVARSMANPSAETARMVMVLNGWELELDVLYGATSIASLIAFLVWVHRLHDNLAIFTNATTTTAAAAVIAYFAPFSNLWVPYRNMRQAWHVAKPVTRDTTRHFPVMLWWTLICSSVGTFAVTTIWSSAHPPPSRGQLQMLVLAASALSVAGGAACIWTVLTLTDRQNEAAARLVRERAAASGG